LRTEALTIQELEEQLRTIEELEEHKAHTDHEINGRRMV
jgi:hypothetical protein